MPEGKANPSPGDVIFGHVPDWLDSGFFEKGLRASLGDPGLRVCRSEVRAAMGKGENYVSIVYAATVSTTAEEGDAAAGAGHQHQHHLIIKCLPSNKARKIMSNKAEFFRKEVDMYEVVFPEFRRLAGGAVGCAPLPWPVHHWSLFDGDRDYLVLEDLRVAGYVMKGRLEGLDAAHLDAALRTLAKFHALSYALKLKEPEVYKTKVYDRYPETMFSVQSEDMIEVFIRNAYRDAAAAIREWDDPKYHRVADWLDEVKDTATRAMIQLLSRDDPGSVLNHGDFWVNNMLFRYPPGGPGSGGGEGAEGPDDVKLLDFQISRVCSPAGDLSYLMVTSTTTADRRAHWDMLLRTTYLEAFWDTLGALGAKCLAESQAGVYTWPWLQSEMLRYRPFALVTCLTTTQVMLAETSAAPDMDDMTEEQLTGEDEKGPFSELVKGERYQERLRGLLDQLLDEGLFQ